MEPAKKYLIFETKEGLYGIELKYILKIKNNAKLYELPVLGYNYSGVMYYTNRFIPVIDFEGEKPGSSEADAALILRYRMNEFSIFVKDVLDIYEFQNEGTFDKMKKDFYVDGRGVKLINLEELIGG